MSLDAFSEPPIPPQLPVPKQIISAEGLVGKTVTKVLVDTYPDSYLLVLDDAHYWYVTTATGYEGEARLTTDSTPDLHALVRAGIASQAELDARVAQPEREQEVLARMTYERLKARFEKP